ncbi:iron-containing alcohol dehydrogenase [Chloroflexota bacterium]
MSYGINHLSPVLFGEGASSETGMKLKELGCTKVLCVFDQGVKKAGITEKIIENIKEQGIQTVIFDGVLADPPDHTIEAAAEIGRKELVDGIVAIGGGSSMDTAKAVNILLGNPSPITQYLAGDKEIKPGKVLVLLPTTSGTGSEVTPVAVITDTSNNRKGGILGPVCRATLAIVDPVLTVGMPPSITADTGMDALAHAAEAMTSAFANPMSDILAKEAISLICAYLPRAVKDGSDMEARSNMIFASMTAGYSFADALPHYGHAIGHTLGALYHIPHGNACGIALPEVMEYIVDVIPERVRMVGNAMGLDLAENLSPVEIGKQVADAMRALNSDIGLKTLKAHNIEESALSGIAEMTLSDDTAGFGPKQADVQDILRMLQGAYSI